MIAATIDIECEGERGVGFDRVAMRLARFPEVKDVAVISGRGDLTIRIEANEMEEIFKFVTETLAPMEQIKSTATHFWMKMYKKNGEMLIAEEPAPSRIPVSA